MTRLPPELAPLDRTGATWSKDGKTLQTHCLACDGALDVHLAENGRPRLECFQGCGEQAIRTAIDAAIALSNGTGESLPPEPGATAQHLDPDELRERCLGLESDPRILDRFESELGRIGLVGEAVLAKIVLLAVYSRHLGTPVSVAIKGPSAAGKSKTVDTVLEFVPSEAYFELTGMSERAFAYGEEPLSNRMLVIFEAAGLEGEFASYLIRSLLSEGRLRYQTAEATKEGVRARVIEREGPTGLIVTTTRVRLHPENETRLISVPVTDTPEQTKRVMLSIAAEASGEDVDLSPWHALGEWIAASDHEVTIPYASRLAELIPPLAIRLRRDFSAVLGLIRSHAILHQATRERDERNRIIASLDDYAVVRELVYDLVSEGIGATVSPQTRETVDAVTRLRAEHEEGVPQSALVRELELDRSAVSRRVRVALDRGFLRNLEERQGRPARLVVGEELPEDIEVLPKPEALEGCCTVAGASEGRHTPRSEGDVEEIATPAEEAELDRLRRKFGEPAR